MNLSHWEEVVLVSSSTFLWYARFKEAREHTGISWKEWKDASNSLKDMGLLSDFPYSGTPTAAGMECARGRRMDYVERKVVSITEGGTNATPTPPLS